MAATMIEEALYTRLAGYAGLTALVSGRVYTDQEVPQNPTLPFVAYKFIGDTPVQAMGSYTGLVSPSRFQFTCFAERVLTARAVRAQVIAALNRWRATDGTIEVLDSFTRRMPDPPYEPDTQSRFAIVDALLHYRES